MARPERNNVDYFPFYCDEGNKMFYIEETYGNDGFATFLKILRELAKADFHYLDLSKPTTRMFLSAKCKVSKEVLESIIKDLVDLEKFDQQLWNENSIVWCQDFIDSIKDAYKSRRNDCIDRESLLVYLISKGVRKPSKSIRKPSKATIDSSVYPQSKEEDIKEDKIKVDWDKLVVIFNNITKKKSKIVNAKAKKQILSRFKEGYSKDDLINAITNCYNDQFHTDNNHKWLTLEFISKPDKFETWLSAAKRELSDWEKGEKSQADLKKHIKNNIAG